MNTSKIIARALDRLAKASIAWDTHGQSETSECNEIAAFMNAYLKGQRINAEVTPLDIHNWLGENGVQDDVKFAKVQALVEEIVGKNVVSAFNSRDKIIESLCRKIGYKPTAIIAAPVDKVWGSICILPSRECVSWNGETLREAITMLKDAMTKHGIKKWVHKKNWDWGDVSDEEAGIVVTKDDKEFTGKEAAQKFYDTYK